MTAMTPNTTRSTGRADVADSAKPFRGRRLSWREFYALTGRKREAANDNWRLEPIKEPVQSGPDQDLPKPDRTDVYRRAG